MSTFKILLSFVVISLVFCANKKESSHNDYVKECVECEKEIIKDEDGRLRWEISTLNNKKHGLVRSWWPNGKLSSEKYYKDGELHGPYKMWDENERIIVNNYYRDGKRIKKNE